MRTKGTVHSKNVNSVFISAPHVDGKPTKSTKVDKTNKQKNNPIDIKTNKQCIQSKQTL